MIYRCALALLLTPAVAWAENPKQWDATVDNALAYLRKSQEPNGAWSEKKSPGITGVVLTGVLECERLAPDEHERFLDRNAVIGPRTNHRVARAEPHGGAPRH